MTRTGKDIGSLTMSIDCEHRSANLAQQRAVRSLVSHLLKLSQKHRVPATWSTSSPRRSWFHDQLPTSIGYELAVRAGKDWNSRSQFARRLRETCNTSQAEGVSIHSLIADGPNLSLYADLLAKRQITTVSDHQSMCAGTLVQPSPLRFGLVHLGVSHKLPKPRKWFGDRTLALAKRGIRQASRKRGLCHIAIDCDKLAGLSSEIALEGVFELAAQLQSDDQLSILTLHEVACRCAHRDSQRPARSILRAA